MHHARAQPGASSSWRCNSADTVTTHGIYMTSVRPKCNSIHCLHISASSHYQLRIGYLNLDAVSPAIRAGGTSAPRGAQGGAQRRADQPPGTRRWAHGEQLGVPKGRLLQCAGAEWGPVSLPACSLQTVHRVGLKPLCPAGLCYMHAQQAAHWLQARRNMRRGAAAVCCTGGAARQSSFRAAGGRRHGSWRCVNSQLHKEVI